MSFGQTEPTSRKPHFLLGLTFFESKTLMSSWSGYIKVPVSNGETLSEKRVPFFSCNFLTKIRLAASTKLTFFPPQGHPVPSVKSTPICKLSATLIVWLSISIQYGLKKSIKFFSFPFTPYMGSISTPPIPAFSKAINDLVIFFLSTALPIHHQRVQVLDSLLTFGHW